eukprot:75014-Rhodomonas_salina.1
MVHRPLRVRHFRVCLLPSGPDSATLAREAQRHWPPSLRLQVSTVEKRQTVYHAQCTPEYGAL